MSGFSLARDSLFAANLLLGLMAVVWLTALYARGLSAAEILSLFAAGGHGVCVPPSLAARGMGTNIQLLVTGTTGEAYQLQTAPAVTGPWTNLGPAQIADPAGQTDYSDATQDSQRFYRAAVVDP